MERVQRAFAGQVLPGLVGVAGVFAVVERADLALAYEGLTRLGILTWFAATTTTRWLPKRILEILGRR